MQTETALIFVVEGANDAMLLRKVLQLCIPGLSSRFFAAQGKMMLASVARNIAAELGSPIMVVGDTDSPDQVEAQRFRNDQLEALSMLLPPNLVDAFAFSPDLDHVVAEAMQIEIAASKHKKIQALEQAVSQASAEQLRADKQLGQFLQAVERLWAVIAPEQQTLIEPAAV
ncbi:hypothetical protein [Duganella sp. P38]|uniref:hypothetical protein n=1 Tax=Duganella sp. P38 TaxID=3423949 RepID=UPI003D7AB3FF